MIGCRPVVQSPFNPQEGFFMDQITVEIKDQKNIISARQEGRDMARRLGFRLADQTRLATAISELTRNVIQYAGSGVCMIQDMSDAHDLRIKVVVEDFGPGIPDVDKAMTYGFSTSKGLGAGLPGSKSLVQEFDIQSRPGNTKVTIVMCRRRP